MTDAIIAQIHALHFPLTVGDVEDDSESHELVSGILPALDILDAQCDGEARIVDCDGQELVVALHDGEPVEVVR